MRRSVSEAEREQAYLDSLRAFYHPVATCAALDNLGVDEHGQPRVLAAELLGERIIVARLAEGVVAMRGTCPHRGAGLERGWVNRDCTAVVCRYHGFEWHGSGRLQRIPALEAAGRPLPTGEIWRVDTYPTVVKYGLIWVCLEQAPRRPVLDAAPADDPAYVALPIVEQEWRAGCGRIIEAFIDTYHFPFTHWGSLGDPAHPEAPQANVTLHDDYMYTEYTSVQPRTRAVTYDSAAALATAGEGDGFLTSTYRGWVVPNAVYLLKTTGDVRFGILAMVCPLGPKRSRLYRVLYASRTWDVDHEQLQRNQDAINAEDRALIETARPWELCTDLDAELQTYMDRPTVTYRKWLASMNVQFM